MASEFITDRINTKSPKKLLVDCVLGDVLSFSSVG